MELRSLELKLFFELIAEMPDIEAVDEIDKRLQDIADRRRTSIKACEPNEVRELLNIDEDELRLTRSKLCDRLEARKWSKAVRAVLGEEAFQACLTWMRATPPPDVKKVALRRSNHRR